MLKLDERHKTAIITWMVVYPLITALLFVLEPMMVNWPMPLRTLFLTGVLVPVMVLWAMPKANKFFDNFLHPKTQEN